MELGKEQKIIVSDSEIMQCIPVYRGTRIPVELVADMLEQGATVEEILAGYPALDPEKIALAMPYMLAFPRRDHPAYRPWASRLPSKSRDTLPHHDAACRDLFLCLLASRFKAVTGATAYIADLRRARILRCLPV